MTISLDGKLVVAISSRALFDFEEENEVFEQADDTAYMRLQLERLDLPAKPGVAFSLVQKLLAFKQSILFLAILMIWKRFAQACLKQSLLASTVRDASIRVRYELFTMRFAQRVLKLKKQLKLLQHLKKQKLRALVSCRWVQK